MKAKDVGFVSEAMGNIRTLLNDLANSQELKSDEDKTLISILVEMKDKIERIKEDLDERVVKAKTGKRKKTQEQENAKNKT
jgi:hypothetical protein